jgi:hypothetical protein
MISLRPFRLRFRLRQVLLAGAAILCCAGVALLLVVAKPGVRRVFYFPSLDDRRIRPEVRFLPTHPVQGDIAFFVDELLLGPLTDRGGMLFAPGARAALCVLQDSVLYVDVSVPSLFPQGSSYRLEEGTALIKKNIEKNFPRVKSVTLFLNSKEVLGHP